MKEKNKPIVNHGLLHDTVNYDALIKAQANTLSFDQPVDNSKQKAESAKVKKIKYRRQNRS